MAKMGAKSLSELVRMAMLAKLLPDGNRASSNS